MGLGHPQCPCLSIGFRRNDLECWHPRRVLRTAFSSAGSYQAPKYHIKTMLRARYLASMSDAVLVLSSSSNCNAVDDRYASRLGALRFFLTSRSRFSSADGCFSLAQVKYSRFTLTGSEPGTDLDRSISGAGTVGGFVGRGARPKSGRQLIWGNSGQRARKQYKENHVLSGIRVDAMSARRRVRAAATVTAAVAAAAPVNTVRRVTAPVCSSSIAFGAIGPCMMQRTAHDPSLPLFQHRYRVRLPCAFSSMKVKSDWLKKSSGFMSGGRTCWLTALP